VEKALGLVDRRENMNGMVKAVLDGRVAAPALAARRRFKGYKPEEGMASRKAEIKETEAIRQIKAAWKATANFDWNQYGDCYRRISAAMKEFQCTTNDVEYFSIVLEEFQEEGNFPGKAGLFLSALINRGRNGEYVIHTQHLAMPVHFLGIENEKRIIVNGEAGHHVGRNMKSGSITVEGNAGNMLGFFMQGGNITVEGDTGSYVGERMKGGSISIKGSATVYVGNYMNGGSITVNGDSGDGVGLGMENGSITIKGNVGYRVGALMEGGEITLEGGYESLFHVIKGGRIFHKGKLIVDK
jgi:hypothetical protein